MQQITEICVRQFFRYFFFGKSNHKRIFYICSQALGRNCWQNNTEREVGEQLLKICKSLDRKNRKIKSTYSWQSVFNKFRHLGGKFSCLVEKEIEIKKWHQAERQERQEDLAKLWTLSESETQERNMWEVNTETTSEHRKNIPRWKLKGKSSKWNVILKTIGVRERYGRSLVQYPSKRESYQRVNLRREIV